MTAIRGLSQNHLGMTQPTLEGFWWFAVRWLAVGGFGFVLCAFCGLLFACLFEPNDIPMAFGNELKKPSSCSQNQPSTSCRDSYGSRIRWFGAITILTVCLNEVIAVRKKLHWIVMARTVSIEEICRTLQVLWELYHIASSFAAEKDWTTAGADLNEALLAAWCNDTLWGCLMSHYRQNADFGH